ncbi:PRTRC system protein D [Cupriavidus sp. NPDC089707]|uniref:PRTRC system protein D n=1 Tax=Cupriavidus sp. NPDC089707 TaxID=3363963 RepID=UPI003827B790
MSTTKTIAVDVGFGNTKFAFPLGADIATRMFPSLAPTRSASSLANHGDGYFQSRDVVHVTVDGAEYEVGPDVSITSAYGNTGRTLSEDFVTTPEYAALLFGALHYSQARDVGQLILGLPVHTLQKYAGVLQERFAGTHDFGAGSVSIKRVVALPQPLGSLVTFMRQSGKDLDPDDNCLIVDVGYFTTDWVVARGYMMDDTRSGGVPGGSSRIYQQVAQLLSADEGGEPSGSIERIDKSLRDGKLMRYYNKMVDLRPYFEVAKAQCQTAVKEMQTRVGRTEDIAAIVLTGGGSALYSGAIRAAFPRSHIVAMESPCYANVRGFFDIGSARQARG